MAKQKDYFAFMEDMSSGSGTIRRDFAKLVSKPDLTEEHLQEFFKKNGYGAISREDCAKIFAALKALCKAVIAASLLYY